MRDIRLKGSGCSRIFSLLIYLLIAGIEAIAVTPEGKEARGLTIKGKIVDAHNRKGLPSVTVSLEGSNVGTVSNSDGRFSLYCPADTSSVPGVTSSRVAFSTVGYASVSIPLDSLAGRTNTIRMEKLPVELSELVVYGGEPLIIIEEALKRIPKNYSAKPDMLSLFYRETIRKGKRFIGVSEAAIDVYKTAYTMRVIDNDRVKIERGRRLVSQQSSDTLAVKIIGGPNLAVTLDFVKNADVLFTVEELGDFDFKMERLEYIEDRLQYVISFKPIIKREYIQFQGTLYIDCERLAFTRAEFEMPPNDKLKMAAAVLYKKPRGLRFIPQKISYVVAFKYVDGKSYLNYVSNEMRFKCDMKRRLFSSSYTAYTEMVVVDREENTDNRISYKSAFKPRQIFYDVVDEYWDEGYWNDFNIIEPTESLEHAVDKLKKTGKSTKME